MDLGIRNAEGYYDLTAYEAIKNVTEEERRKNAIRTLLLSGRVVSNKNKHKAVRT